MPRGGMRKGVVGKQYQNRADMRGANVVSAQPANTGAKLPVATASGQPYGAATVQRNAQQQVGMAGTQTPTPPQVQAGAPQQEQAPTPSAPLTPLFAPSTQPNNPVTDGVPNSPGAGPEILNLTSPVVGQYNDAKSYIQSLASSANSSPALQFLAQRINGAY